MTALDHYLLDAVRIGLSACVAGRPRHHPDSSRQRKARQRDMTRYEVRRMKERQPTYLPKLPMTTQEQAEHARRWLRVGGFGCANADGLTTGRISTRS